MKLAEVISWSLILLVFAGGAGVAFDTPSRTILLTSGASASGGVEANNTFYEVDGSLAGDRLVNGDGHSLTFADVPSLHANGTDGFLNYQLDYLFDEYELRLESVPDNAYTSMHSTFEDLSFIVYLDGDFSMIDVNDQGIRFRDDIAGRGAVYAADYSANFVDRSLVDKAYVDNLVATNSANYVPYTGASQNVDLGVHNLSTSGLVDGVDVSVLKNDFDTHEADFSNPHHVTASQVGLDSTDDLAEGVTNWYYTSSRFDNDWNAKLLVDVSDVSNAGLADGKVLKWNSTQSKWVPATDEVGSSGSFGDVYGPSSSTDNAVARFDGTTGKYIQDSSVIISDDGSLKVGDYLINARTSDERVGINTAAPDTTLHVKGDFLVTPVVGDAFRVNDTVDHYVPARFENQFAMVGDSDGGQEITTTVTVIDFGDVVVSDSQFSVPSNTRVVVSDAGLYEVSYVLNTENNGYGFWGAYSSNLKSWVRINGSTTAPYSTSYSYTNDDYDPYATNAASFYVTLGANAYVELLAQEVGSGGHLDTLAGETWMTIKRLR